MNKILTKKEWHASLAETFSRAVEATYQKQLEEAIKAEREACAKEADKWSKRDDDVGAFIGKAIRARENQ